MQCVLGTFGSGKTAFVCDYVRTCAKRTLIVCPTETHRQQFPSEFNVQSAPKFLHNTTDEQLTSLDTILIDDADYPLGFRWSMSDVFQRISQCSAAPAVIFTSRSAVRVAPVMRTLYQSIRFDTQNKHTEFLHCLFNDRYKSHVSCNNLTLQPFTSYQRAAALIVEHVTFVDTVILCDNKQLRCDIVQVVAARQRIKPEFTFAEFVTNSNTYCSQDVILSSVQNFFGLSRKHVLFIADSSTPQADLIEGCTRHSKTLCVFFPADAPPPLFAKHNCKLRKILGKCETLVNWDQTPTAISEPLTIGRLARTITSRLKTASVDAALAALYEMLPNIHMNVTHVAPRQLSHRVDGSTRLGRFAEAFVTSLLGRPFLTIPDIQDILRNNHMLKSQCIHTLLGGNSEASLQPLTLSTLNASQHETLLELSLVTNVDKNYFEDLKQAVLSTLTPHIAGPLQFPSSTSHVTLNGAVYAGRPDMVTSDCVFELKFMQNDIDAYAVVQAALYAIMCKKQYALVYNIASGQLVRLGILIDS